MSRKLTEQEVLAILMESDEDSDSNDDEVQPSNTNFFNFDVEEDRDRIPIPISASRKSRIEKEQEENEIDKDDELEVVNEIDLENACFISDGNTEYVLEENIEIQIFDETRGDFNMKLTDKQQIQWRRRPEYVRSEILYDEVAIHPNETDEMISPMFFFEKYFNDELFELMAENTNIYALQQGISFSPTNIKEIKKLFGIHLFLGSTRFPRTNMYWSKLLGISHVMNAMSRDRFYQLRSNLHCINNLEIPENNKDVFIKVRPVINAVRERCLQLKLEEKLCIDEQIIPFKGRLSAKQYIKNKPNKWGIKLFALCGSSGQPYDFFLYQGSYSELSEYNKKSFGFGAAVVLHLVQRVDKPGHTLFFDNYFTSYTLLEILKNKKINAAGTARINRFYKPPFQEDKQFKKLPRGSFEELSDRDQNVVVVKWLDNKPIHIASNFVGKGDICSATRWDNTLKRHIEIPQPEIVSLYNKGMGGVDILDQTLSYYRTFIKSRKWNLRVIAHFLDFAVSSSWMEYRKEMLLQGQPQHKIKDLLEFRMEISYYLLNVAENARKRGRPSSIVPCTEPSNRHRSEVRPIQDIQYDNIGHLPEADKNKEATRCKLLGCRGRTHIYCRKCNVHLCLINSRNCYVKFHTNPRALRT